MMTNGNSGKEPESGPQAKEMQDQAEKDQVQKDKMWEKPIKGHTGKEQGRTREHFKSLSC